MHAAASLTKPHYSDHIDTTKMAPVSLIVEPAWLLIAFVLTRFHRCMAFFGVRRTNRSYTLSVQLDNTSRSSLANGLVLGLLEDGTVSNDSAYEHGLPNPSEANHLTSMHDLLKQLRR